MLDHRNKSKRDNMRIKIILIILLSIISEFAISATIYSINQSDNSIKIKSELIPDEFKKINNTGKILFDGYEKSVEVISIININRIILKLSDVSDLALGDKIEFVLESANNSYSQVNSDSYKYFSSSSSYSYKLNPSGLRDYLDEELYNNNQPLYNKLNGDLILLESRESISQVITILSSIVGGAMLVISGSIEESDKFSTQDKERGEEIGIRGLFIVLGGVGLGYILKPNKSELVNILKKHNSSNSTSPVKLLNEETTKNKASLNNSQFSLLGGNNTIGFKYTYDF